MTYTVIRNNNQFGPYSIEALASYVQDGKILKCDKAFSELLPNNVRTVGYFLKMNRKKVRVKHIGSALQQIKNIGRELIVPNNIFAWKEMRKDSRMLWLALLGLAPALLIKFLSSVPFLTFYVIALYFSVIWGLFFYYFFKTPQIKVTTTILLFFIMQAIIFVLWDILSLPSWPVIDIFYAFTNSNNFIFRLIGYIVGVGLCEEIVKTIPLLWIMRRAREPYIPQSFVFYGLMSGIAFGVYEGVQYQMTVNAEMDYSNAFFMNVARLTSLPFLHAIWTGIAGYFIAFATLYPKYLLSLYALAIIIPAVIHGLYDTLGWTVFGFLLMLLSIILLMSYLKQEVNYQSKLSK